MAFKWCGRKKWIVKKLHSTEEIFEPFCGSAEVSFSLSEKCHLNDVLQPLVDVYHSLTSNRSAFLGDLKTIFSDFNQAADAKDYFYQIRDEFNQGGQSDPVLFSAILMSGFNGLWRQGPSGCTVTYGGKRSLKIESFESIPVGKIASLRCQEWDTLQVPNDRCLIYCDPPYTNTHNAYVSRGWSFNDDRMLICQMSNVKNPVIISMNWSDIAEKELQSSGFTVKTVTRNFHVGGPNVKRAVEIVAFNDRASSLVRTDPGTFDER